MLIKTKDNTTVYYLDTEKQTKHAVTSQVFKQKGYNPHEIAEVNQIHLDSYLAGGQLK
jgi:hypothetical protein